MKRRLLASMLSLVMILSLLPVAAMADGEEETTPPMSGYCGGDAATEEYSYLWQGVQENHATQTVYKNIAWEVVPNGENDKGTTYKLVLTGSGPMFNFTYDWIDALSAAESNIPWWDLRTQITAVDIADGITTISDFAFFTLRLESVEIPDSVTTIGTHAISRNAYLKRVVIGAGVREIKDCGFYHADALESLTFKDGADLTIGQDAFYGANVETLTIPSRVRNVKYRGFGYWTSLKSVVFEENTDLALASGTFEGCTALTDVDMSAVNSDSSKMGSVFSGCTALNNVKLPTGSNFTKLPSHMFSGCTALKAIVVPANITAWDNQVFGGSGVHTVVFETENITGSLGNNWLEKITAEKVVIYTQNKESAAWDKAGEGHTGLWDKQKQINAVTNGGTFPAGTVFEEGVLATPVKGNSVFAGWYENADFSGSRVTTPEVDKTYYAKWVDGADMWGVCGEADHETDVQWKLTQNLDVAGTYTLTIKGDGNMADFTQPNLPTATGASIAPWYTALSAAADATNHSVPITKVVVKDGVTGLGNWAFAYTQVNEATFTPSVKQYGIRIYSYCRDLETVNWDGFEPEKVLLAEDTDKYYEGCGIPSNMFDWDTALHICKLGNKTYTDELVVPDTVTAVGTSGFYHTAFTTVDFKTGLKNVRQVGIYSFARMTELQSLTIPGNMTFVLAPTDKNGNQPSNAFAEESSLTSMVIEEGITTIPASMASRSWSMETLKLPSTLKSIEHVAFQNTKNLHSVDMSKVTGITVNRAFNAYNGEPAQDVVTCIFYVNNSTVRDTLYDDNWDKRPNDKVIYAVTDGGTFSDKTVFKAGKLAAPEKTGYKFIGWYTDVNDETTKVTEETVLAAGQTYYAKWHESAELSTDIGEKTFVVGADPVEFTFTSTAHDDVGTMVKSYFEFSDPDAIQSLEYFGTTENEWLPLNGTVFGPVATGYPMLNATSRFRVTFKKAGDYTLTVSCKTVDGNETVVCSTSPIAITVAKGAGKVTAPTAIENLVYNGSEQTLINAGSSTTGEIQYKLGENGTYDTELPKATNAGTYTVYYKVIGNENYNEVAEASIEVTIAKAAGSVTAPTAKELTYTGEAQELVDAGSSDTGTIQYKLDNGEYSENVPMAMSAGTYTVYYKVVGDANHNDVAEASITVTITKADQAKPEAPTLKGRSYTSITLNEVAGAEYSKDGGKTWQTSPEFTGLTSGTTYEFVIRYAETDNYNASDASDAAKFTTRRYSSAAVTPTPTPEPEPTPDDSSKFIDVPANAYFAGAVEWAVEKGITNGLTDTMFGPYESCTRAQIVTFLWRAAGSPEPKAMSSFSDVPASAYYAKAVAWAVENGITNGMTETTFAPNATCTRGQSVTFLYRALKGTASDSANFADVASDAFYADAVNWAVANNVTNGTSATTFSPNADCTRAEIVTFLYRAYQGK